MSLLSRPARPSRSLLLPILIFLTTALACSASQAVRVLWNPNPENDISHYRLHYGTDESSLSGKLDAVGATSAVVEGLEDDTTYHFALQAVNTSGIVSERSAVVSYHTGLTLATSPALVVLDGNGDALVNDQEELSFGTLVVGGAHATTLVITLANAGEADLVDIGAALSGAAAGDFSITRAPQGIVTAGGETSLEVTFNPLSTGTRNAVLEITSNDPANGTFRISLAGAGNPPPVTAVPEISVETSNGSGLVSGSATLDFGSVLPGASSTTTMLTIRNTGTADLTGLAATVSGGNAADFLIQSPAASIAPDGTTTVGITFRPGAIGTRSAVLVISSNDGDEGSFAIQLAGTGKATPEIAIERGGSPLVSGNATLGFGSLLPGTTSAPIALTIRNSGSAALTGITAVVSGTNAADFLVQPTLPTSIAAGATTTFNVFFQPGAVGSRTAKLTITSNDADEGIFVIQLSGAGTATPEIAVADAQGNDLSSGSSALSMGSAPVRDGTRRMDLTVRNTGGAALTGIVASLSGSNAADFAIATTPAGTLVPGGQTTVSLVFSPAAAGTRSATLRIASNDADESSFAIGLSGVGTVAPQIEVVRVQSGKVEQSSGFGDVEVGKQSEGITYAIRNTGTGLLSQLSLKLGGDHSGDFAVTPLDAKLLAPGGSTEFTLSFAPAAIGARAAVLQIYSNDPENNPFELSITGNGISFPNIIVSGTDGGFGSARTGDKGEVRSFVIRNTGGAPLRNVRVGTGSAEFRVISQPAAVIDPGAKGIVTVRFEPKAAGRRTAVLRIQSNDLDERLVSIPLAGTGIATPEIRVAAGRAKLVDGDAYVAFGSGKVGKKGRARKIVVTNQGTAPLTGLKVRKNWLHAGDFKVTRLKKKLAPGESATLKVTFKPKSKGNRWAELHIASNDPDARSFDIVLNGIGVQKKTKKSQRKSAVLKPAKSSVTKNGTELVVHKDGKRYRAIKIHKSAKPDVLPRDIQVSGNLLDWSSGSRHTTVVKNNDKVLIVRDNTPLGHEKRHIRLNRRR